MTRMRRNGSVLPTRNDTYRRNDVTKGTRRQSQKKRIGDVSKMECDVRAGQAAASSDPPRIADGNLFPHYTNRTTCG
jgi:hypothetical protein